MIKDPNAKLDFGFNWRPDGKEWLEEDETITSYVITVPTGIVKESDSESDGVVTVWLSGGKGGVTYPVECKITTNKGRVDERSLWVIVQER